MCETRRAKLRLDEIQRHGVTLFILYPLVGKYMGQSRGVFFFKFRKKNLNLREKFYILVKLHSLFYGFIA